MLQSTVELVAKIESDFLLDKRTVECSVIH